MRYEMKVMRSDIQRQNTGRQCPAIFQCSLSNRLKSFSFRERKGASGSWAEPCFACPALRYGVFPYPPGILIAVFNGRIK